MYSDNSSKSELLNKHVQSVFIKKSTTATPRLFGNKYPSIGNLSITLKGVQTLLEKINISKAAGPDLIPGRMLNMLAAVSTDCACYFYSESGHWRTTKVQGTGLWLTLHQFSRKATEFWLKTTDQFL